MATPLILQSVLALTTGSAPFRLRQGATYEIRCEGPALVVPGDEGTELHYQAQVYIAQKGILDIAQGVPVWRDTPVIMFCDVNGPELHAVFDTQGQDWPSATARVWVREVKR